MLYRQAATQKLMPLPTMARVAVLVCMLAMALVGQLAPATVIQPVPMVVKPDVQVAQVAVAHSSV